MPLVWVAVRVKSRFLKGSKQVKEHSIDPFIHPLAPAMLMPNPMPMFFAVHIVITQSGILSIPRIKPRRLDGCQQNRIAATPTNRMQFAILRTLPHVDSIFK